MLLLFQEYNKISDLFISTSTRGKKKCPQISLMNTNLVLIYFITMKSTNKKK